MDELRSGKAALLVLALGLTISFAGFAQEQKPASQESGDAKQKSEQKATTDTKAASSEKTVDTSAKVLPTPAKKRTGSPLVDAAKDAKANKAKARIVIDNDDVKKSSGKLTVLKPRPELEVPAEGEGTREKLERDKAVVTEAKKKAEERLEKARKTVDELENELARLEEEYYTEADLDYRDDVIEERFNETKAQLDKAREEMSSARDELSKADVSQPAPAEKPPSE